MAQLRSLHRPVGVATMRPPVRQGTLIRVAGCFLGAPACCTLQPAAVSRAAAPAAEHQRLLSITDQPASGAGSCCPAQPPAGARIIHICPHLGGARLAIHRLVQRIVQAVAHACSTWGWLTMGSRVEGAAGVGRWRPTVHAPQGRQTSRQGRQAGRRAGATTPKQKQGAGRQQAHP